ncbi:hypothetical protein ACWD11_30335 [Streptomyces sp. NPDC002776]
MSPTARVLTPAPLLPPVSAPPTAAAGGHARGGPAGHGGSPAAERSPVADGRSYARGPDGRTRSVALARAVATAALFLVRRHRRRSEGVAEPPCADTELTGEVR